MRYQRISGSNHETSLIPNHPNYTVVNLYVPSLDNNQSSSSNSSTAAEFLLEIKNPNKDSGIYYDDTVVSLFWGDGEYVGTMTIPSFYQSPRNTARYQASIDRSSRGSWDGMRRREMKVLSATKIRYKTWGVKSKHHGVNMQGNVQIGSDGKIVGKKKKKKLHSIRKK
ncbi:hypothetical protein ACLOJK_029353 [Asimina triloba]